LIATLPDDVVQVLAPKLHRYTCPVGTPVLNMCVVWAARFTTDARHSWLREQVGTVLYDKVAAARGRSKR
jgi:hypothetical protein